jgi:hypothetical protein
MTTRRPADLSPDAYECHRKMMRTPGRWSRRGSLTLSRKAEKAISGRRKSLAANQLSVTGG